MASKFAAVHVEDPGEDPLGPLLRKIRARDRLAREEEAVLRASVFGVCDLPLGWSIVRAGAPLAFCTLLIDGFAARYRSLADGHRQIMEVHVPGDFLDLHSVLLGRLEHDVGALTPARVARVPHAAVKRITEEYPHLARLLWFSTLLDAAIHRERILSVGRRTALARVAHLFCELFVRLDLVGLAEGGRFALALTQADLADACGLTSEHVNRMLRKLRDDGLLTLRGGEAIIHDWEQLRRVAEFSPDFLFLERRPL